MGASGRNVLLESEFSIPLPAPHSSQGTGRIDILNLEEQPSTSKAHMPLTLGPMVVTDDEGSTIHDHEGKPSKHQRIQKLRHVRGHRRTASTGSHVISLPNNEPAPSIVSSLPPTMHGPVGGKQKAPKYQHRPGSAGSTRPDVQIVNSGESQSQMPDNITQTAHALRTYMDTLIDEVSPEEEGALKTVNESVDQNKPSSSAGMMRPGRAMSQGASAGQSGGGQLTVKGKHKYSEIRIKPVNKSTDSNETTSSEGANSVKSSSSEQSANGSAGKRMEEGGDLKIGAEDRRPDMIGEDVRVRGMRIRGGNGEELIGGEDVYIKL